MDRGTLGNRLFDPEVARHDGSPRRHTESPFQYLSRVPGRYADRDRLLLELAYRAFPDPHHQLRGNLTSRGLASDGHFWGAVTAMQAYRYFRRRGFECEADEERDRIGRSPDLLVEAPDGQKLAIEITTIGETDAHHARTRQVARLVTELESRVDLRGYLIDLTYVPDVGSTLPIKKIASFLQQALDRLPPAHTQHPGVMTEVILSPNTSGVRGRILKGLDLGRLSQRILVSGPDTWTWPGNRIRKRLEEKRPSAKGLAATMPYLVVIATRLSDLQIDDVVQSLYGVPRGTGRVDPGLLIGNSRISGVLWVPRCQLRNTLRTHSVFFENWSARSSLDFGLLPWALRAISSGIQPLSDNLEFETRQGGAINLLQARKLVHR